MTPGLCGICAEAESLSVLADLDTRIQFGLDELVGIRIQMSPPIARTGKQELPVMETAAACAMLHSFFNTGIASALSRTDQPLLARNDPGILN